MRLFLIDGHALVFKMYYAFLRRPMINSKGADTSILFGFTKYLLELIEKENPSHLAVAFDPPGGTFRNELYPAYKANRAETPQLVIDALEPLTELCGAMNIPVLMVPGYEADDVIGTVAQRFASPDMDVFMVTPDKDYGQLIADHVWQYKPGRAGGENELVGVKEICERYGIGSPSQVIDMLTICGDASDNVPGVRGVGEVGAGQLVSQYGSIENIYEHIGELTQKQSMMFEAARGHYALSKQLVTIRTDVPVKVKASEMKLNLNYSPRIADLFEKYEFNSLKKYISHIGNGKKAKAAEPLRTAVTLDVREVTPFQLSQFACIAGRCAIVVEPERGGIFAPVRSVTMATLDKDTPVVAKGPLSDFRWLIEDSAVQKYGYGLKLQLNLLEHAGVHLAGRLRDIELMHYLLDPEKSHDLVILAKHYLGVDLDAGREEAKVGSLFDEVVASAGEEETVGAEAAAIMLLGLKLWPELQQGALAPLYEKMEEPLIRVLGKMERTGVKVDTDSLRDFAEGLRAEIAERETFVREFAGVPDLNVSSPKQLGVVIFEKLKLDPKARKSAGGNWSTDEETLLELRDKSPIIDAILEYRAAKKLLSTYIEPFPGYVSPVDGRVHTTFNQALTATGRLSSSNPNLQNIPIRTERGQQIRKAFVPENPADFILSADYSQIELRIMAHLSQDEHLIAAFRAGQDVHAATASKIFGVPVEEVTPEQRRIAKTANFGIMYGISAFGLAQRLQLPRSEAKQIIDGYFATFPAISDFIGKTLASARETGYVETLFGRRRYIPDINAKNGSLRAIAERNAVNAPIQGSSADIIKLAMIRVAARLQERGMRSRMVLQIHDELLFETPPEEVEALQALVVAEMEHVIALSIPLTVECSYGKNWLEAH